MKLVILISGKKRHGKNQLAMYMNEAFLKRGLKLAEFAFAHVLKEIVARDFDKFTEEHLYGNKKEERVDGYNKTCREVLQHIGEFYRSIEPNYWINALKRKILDANYYGKKKFDVVVVTDCRYPNEMDWHEFNVAVDAQGNCNPVKVMAIRVYRPGLQDGDTHSSETSLDNYDKFDMVILNDSSLEELRKKAENIVDGICKDMLNDNL